MRLAALLLLLAGLAPAAVRAADRGSGAAWDLLLAQYRPGGALEGRLAADIARLSPGAARRLGGRDEDVLALFLNDPDLNPLGPEAGARWFRARLIELRGPVAAPAGKLIGWVREEGAKDDWKSVAVGVQEAWQ